MKQIKWFFLALTGSMLCLLQSCSGEGSAKYCVEQFIAANIQKDDATCIELYPEMEGNSHITFESVPSIEEHNTEGDSVVIVSAGDICSFLLTDNKTSGYTIIDSRNFLTMDAESLDAIAVLDNTGFNQSEEYQQVFQRNDMTDLEYMNKIDMNKIGSYLWGLMYDGQSYNECQDFMYYLFERYPEVKNAIYSLESYSLVNSSDEGSEYEIKLKGGVCAGYAQVAISAYDKEGECSCYRIADLEFEKDSTIILPMYFDISANNITKIGTEFEGGEYPYYVEALCKMAKKKLIKFTGKEYQEFKEQSINRDEEDTL